MVIAHNSLYVHLILLKGQAMRLMKEHTHTHTFQSMDVSQVSFQPLCQFGAVPQPSVLGEYVMIKYMHYCSELDGGDIFCSISVLLICGVSWLYPMCFPSSLHTGNFTRKFNVKCKALEHTLHDRVLDSGWSDGVQIAGLLYIQALVQIRSHFHSNSPFTLIW